MKTKAIMNWSGGKDSALALHTILRTEEFGICALLTTVTAGYDRISMHGVRRKLLEEQSASIGIPLHIVEISKKSSSEEYETKMKETLIHWKAKGVTRAIFGDIFLQDLRAWREKKLSEEGFTGLFPLWKKDTHSLAEDFIRQGFKGIITCTDTKFLDGAFAGREYDAGLIHDLPATVDPCGENGEFHSFVYDGPIFKKPVGCTRGETVLRNNRFSYCDLLPLNG